MSNALLNSDVDTKRAICSEQCLEVAALRAELAAAQTELAAVRAENCRLRAGITGAALALDNYDIDTNLLDIMNGLYDLIQEPANE